MNFYEIVSRESADNIDHEIQICVSKGFSTIM